MDQFIANLFDMDEFTVRLKLALGKCASSFNMERSVCNHGLFMMPPNVWMPSTKSLCRPLRLADSSTSVSVTISHPSNKPFLVIKVQGGVKSLSTADEAAILVIFSVISLFVYSV